MSDLLQIKDFVRSDLYDLCWNTIDTLQQQLHICDTRKGSHGKFMCRRDQNREVNGCCGGVYSDQYGRFDDGHCKHLGPTGCTVKSLFCKMWCCEAITDQLMGHQEYQQYFDCLDEIEHMVREQRIPLGFRLSKEEAFARDTYNTDISMPRFWMHKNTILLKPEAGPEFMLQTADPRLH